MRILLVGEESQAPPSVRYWLEQDPHLSVSVAQTGEDGVELTKLYEYDVAAVDLNKVDLSAEAVVRVMRRAKVPLPMLVVAPFSTASDRAATLDMGADDCLSKPIVACELLARLRALTRRAHGHARATLQVGNVIFDLNRRFVSVNGKKLELGPKQLQVLEHFMLRAGVLVRRESVISRLYGDEVEPESNIINMLVSLLRRKIARNDNKKNYFRVVWGEGYIFEEPYSEAAE